MPPLFDEISRVVTEHEDELVDFRRDLHRHPELGRAEVRTTRRVAERLETAGIAVRRLQGTGLVADIGAPEPVVRVGLRADLVLADLHVRVGGEEKQRGREKAVPALEADGNAPMRDLHAHCCIMTA